MEIIKVRTKGDLGNTKNTVLITDPETGEFGVSGFFRLVTPYVRNKVLPLPYGTDQATTCHSSGCAYRQLRCCKF